MYTAAFSFLLRVRKQHTPPGLKASHHHVAWIGQALQSSLYEAYRFERNSRRIEAKPTVASVPRYADQSIYGPARCRGSWH